MKCSMLWMFWRVSWEKHVSIFLFDNQFYHLKLNYFCIKAFWWLIQILVTQLELLNSSGSQVICYDLKREIKRVFFQSAMVSAFDLPSSHHCLHIFLQMTSDWVRCCRELWEFRDFSTISTSTQSFNKSSQFEIFTRILAVKKQWGCFSRDKKQNEFSSKKSKNTP